MLSIPFSIVTHKITLVLTPTISLMADQTTSLLAKGLRATFLGTAQKDPSAEHSVKNGEVDIVYLTPERLFTETGTIQHPFLDLIEQQRIGLVAIDEAHLVWSWNSFRCGHICIMCLTCLCNTCCIFLC